MTVVAACGNTAPTNAVAAAPGAKYTVVLSNNYMGNDWRPQMENVAKFVATSTKYKDKVDLQIRNSAGTAAAQIQSLQSIIRQKPAAIMIDAASPTALNPTIAQACAAGILVFSFDQVVTADCAYKLPQDYSAQGADMINFLAKAMGGKGNILMDTGLPGIPISETFVKVWKQTIAEKYPNIKVVGTFSSQYAAGPELQGVSALLASNPKVDGILSGGYCSSDITALTTAGRKLVPMTCLDANGNEQACVKASLSCLFIGAPAFVSGIALQHIVDILSKSASHPKSEAYYDANFVTTSGDNGFLAQQKVVQLKDGVNFYPNDSAALITPVTFGDFNIKPSDVLGG